MHNQIKLRQSVVLVACMGLFLVAGLYFMLASRAATSVVALEPELGLLSGSATVASDITASNGKSVKFGAAAPSTGGTQEQLINLIQDVRAAKGYRYGTRDSQGSTMDTAKVIENPSGGYLAAYHTGNTVRLATSTDMLNWTYKVTLDPASSQPTIMAISSGGFIMAAEYNNGSGGQLRLKHYPNLTALYAGSADKTYTAARTLSNCNEGTPSINSVSLNPDISNSVIDLGIHYHRNCDVDRQARATLTNFTTWTTQAQPALDTALISAATAVGQTVNGNVGDRDTLPFGGSLYNIHEVQYVKGSTGQNGSFASWRPYIYNHSTGAAKLLTLTTHKGSTAFANPTFTLVKSPSGAPSIVVTMFVPSEGAASGEGGELIYYSTLP